MKVIKLTKGYFSLIDDCDYELVSQYKWHVQFAGGRKIKYAASTIGIVPSQSLLLMHDLIMKPSGKMVVDHKDFDGLNNTRKNLRICNRSQNTAHRRSQDKNTSGFRGVCFDKSKKKYKSSISWKNRHIHLGYFNNPIEAAKKYNEFAYILYGEFARLNNL